MAIALRGKISHIPIMETIRFLTRLKATGRLSIRSPKGNGALFFTEGRLVHAAVADLEGTEAFLSLIISENGTFTYEPDIEDKHATLADDTDHLLKEGGKKLQEWRKIKESVPNLDIVFQMCPQTESPEIRLSANEWQIISQTDGSRTVREIRESSGLSGEAIVEALSHLAGAGLIEAKAETAESRQTNLTPEELTALHSELATRIGPIASMLMEDISEELGYELKTFPVSRFSELVKRMTSEIPHAAQQESFKKSASTLLKR